MSVDPTDAQFTTGAHVPNALAGSGGEPDRSAARPPEAPQLPEHVRAVPCTTTDMDALSVGDRVFVRREHGGIATWDDARVSRAVPRVPGCVASVEVTTVFDARYTVIHPRDLLYRPPLPGEGWASVPLTPVYGVSATIHAHAAGIAPELGQWLVNVLRAHLDAIGVVSVHVETDAVRRMSARRVDVYSHDGQLLAENQLEDLAHRWRQPGSQARARSGWLDAVRRGRHAD